MFCCVYGFSPMSLLFKAILKVTFLSLVGMYIIKQWKASKTTKNNDDNNDNKDENQTVNKNNCNIQRHNFICILFL